MNTKNRFIALIPAAGIGTRMGEKCPKQYLSLGQKTVIEHCLATFLDHPAFLKVVVVLNPEDSYWHTLACSKHPKIHTCMGSDIRMLSVYNGLLALSHVVSDNDWICVHDAARCLLHSEDLDNLLSCVAESQQGCVLADKVHDTVKRVTDSRQQTVSTVSRDKLWLAQTPQIFRYHDLMRAFALVITENKMITDEAEAIEQLHLPTQLLQAKHPNFKITTPQDLALARMIIEQIPTRSYT